MFFWSYLGGIVGTSLLKGQKKNQPHSVYRLTTKSRKIGSTLELTKHKNLFVANQCYLFQLNFIYKACYRPDLRTSKLNKVSFTRKKLRARAA